MTKKNTQTNYAQDMWKDIKKQIQDKVISFAIGAIVAIGASYLTILADHQRLVAVETNKADKKDVEIMNYKLDLMLEHFDIKFEPKE